MFTNCYLKPATMEDVDLIFEWANDEEERRNSFNPEKIKYKDHCSWYKRKMEGNDTFIYVYYMDETPVGQVRIEIEEDKALISYFISKDYRGKGHGKNILKLLKEKVKEVHPTIKSLVAQVKTDNTASQRVFKGLGFYESMYYELKL